MKQTLSYNIHNILKFQINSNTKYGFSNLPNLKFSSFRVESVDKPDMVLNIGRFTPSNSNCYVVDHKYYVKNNYLYCHDSNGKASWQVEITGLEQGNTTINFNITRRFQPQPTDLIYVPLFLPQAFLLRIIDYRLSTMGYFLAHAGAMAKDNQAYLLCGRAGCFKTSLCMEFVRRAGFTWLGDDRVIMHKGKVLGFPMNSSMFKFMTERLPDETRWNNFRLLQFTAGQLLGKHKQTPEPKPGSAKIKAILVIDRNSGPDGNEKVTLSPTPQSQLEQVTDSLAISSKLEDFKGLGSFGINSAPFWHYMLAYSFVFPESLIAAQEKQPAKSLRNALDNIPIYRVSIPPEYSPSTFNQIHQFLSELGG